MKNSKNYRAIFIGAMLLTINAGFINAIVIVGFYHHAVSYMTGNLANIGLGIETGQPLHILVPLLIVAFFICGAVVSGMLISSSRFSINQNYAKALILLAIILTTSTLLMKTHNAKLLSLSECLAAMGCGLQNAMTTTFSGAIIRTTHMTGVVTDLGIQLGRLLKGETYEAWKIILFCSLTCCFTLGSIIGLAMFSLLKTDAMWASVAGCFIIGLSYYLWGHEQ